MVPVMALVLPVLMPLSVSVVVLPAVETPVTAPMLKRFAAFVPPAVNVALPPLPWMAMAELIVSVWAPAAVAVWIVPPLESRRLPVWSV